MKLRDCFWLRSIVAIDYKKNACSFGSTTYGKTIAMSAKLSAADRRAVTMRDYKLRHQAFLQMIARKKEMEDQQGQNAPNVMYDMGRCATTPSPSRYGKVLSQ